MIQLHFPNTGTKKTDPGVCITDTEVFIIIEIGISGTNTAVLKRGIPIIVNRDACKEGLTVDEINFLIFSEATWYCSVSPNDLRAVSLFPCLAKQATNLPGACVFFRLPFAGDFSRMAYPLMNSLNEWHLSALFFPIRLTALGSPKMRRDCQQASYQKT